MGHWETGTPGTPGQWDPGSPGHWDTETLGLWDTGTLEHWTLGHPDTEIICGMLVQEPTYRNRCDFSASNRKLQMANII